ncbi:hypothetical protein Hanom_Chr12g01131531 [Helianthus anomalus]
MVPLMCLTTVINLPFKDFTLISLGFLDHHFLWVVFDFRPIFPKDSFNFGREEIRVQNPSH